MNVPDETSSDPPLSGPELFRQRRAQWLTPRQNAPSRPPYSPPPPSIARLDTLLAKDGIEEDEKIWKQHLAEIHRSLVGGSRLKKGLKLSWVIKILRGGWLRDGTWALAAASPYSNVVQYRQATPIPPYPSLNIASPVLANGLIYHSASRRLADQNRLPMRRAEGTEYTTEDGRSQGG